MAAEMAMPSLLHHPSSASSELWGGISVSLLCRIRRGERTASNPVISAHGRSPPSARQASARICSGRLQTAASAFFAAAAFLRDPAAPALRLPSPALEPRPALRFRLRTSAHRLVTARILFLLPQNNLPFPDTRRFIRLLAQFLRYLCTRLATLLGQCSRRSRRYPISSARQAAEPASLLTTVIPRRFSGTLDRSILRRCIQSS